ncbi:hypothetical protein EJV47_06350 [Hymenobacter gummosus]|uniref:Uncharacterized protein n=1 Tax=Hymenobacter gummosus TaxID=1776032 RepID=A0A431U566_9BACT|nr:hypothetical protein EJV47_06350 [Hymenobacter gummosus]
MIFLLCLALCSCSSYKYGEVESEYVLEGDATDVLPTVERWLKGYRGKIESVSEDEIKANIAIDNGSVGYLCDVTIQIDNGKVNIKTGVKDIVMPHNLVITDEEAVIKSTKIEVMKLIHEPLLSKINQK